MNTFKIKHNFYHKNKIIIQIIFLKVNVISYCRVSVFRPGPAMDGIYVQRTHYNEFVESESKSWALMG